MTFADDLAAVQAAPAPHLDVDVTVNKNLYVLRFEQMDSIAWATESDRHHARPGVLIDEHYGYNMRSLVKAAAPLTGSLVEGDATVPVKDWPALFKAIGGAGFQRVSDALWKLNEDMPAQAVEDAKKALRTSGKSSA